MVYFKWITCSYHSSSGYFSKCNWQNPLLALSFSAMTITNSFYQWSFWISCASFYFKQELNFWSLRKGSALDLRLLWYAYGYWWKLILIDFLLSYFAALLQYRNYASLKMIGMNVWAFEVFWHHIEPRTFPALGRRRYWFFMDSSMGNCMCWCRL